MKRYFKYAKPYAIFFILSPLLMLVEVVCDVKIPALAAEIINRGVVNESAPQIMQLGIQMVLYIVLAISCGIAAAFCATKAAVNFSCDLREDVFIKIQKFSFANIDAFSTGSLVTRLTNDITQIQELVVMSLRMFFRAPGMLIGAVVMAFSINKELALIFVILIPVLTTVIWIILKLSYKKFGFLQSKIDVLNSTVREALINVRVIKSLAREDYETEKFKKVNSDLKKTGLAAYRITILQMPLMTLAVNLATIAIVWFGSKGAVNGTMQIGDITAFITYLTQILISLVLLTMVFLQSARAIVSSRRIFEVLDTKTDLVDGENACLEHKVTKGAIQFKNVDFRYYKDNKEKVLSSISLDIQSGQTVGIIGSTGCGKTSLVQLIPRLYDVTAGAVYVDGVDVRDYSLENLRGGVAVVLQNNVLFSGTIEKNLLWGDKNSSADQLKTASSWAAADDFIENMSEKYHTLLGQGGVNLSGGQKQRLCIARALLKKPKILILDDSTSAVDTQTEATIRSHLMTELHNTTKIIIAQRISSVIEADMIIVMNDGAIEAIGKHEELVKNCTAYKEIYNSQMDKGEIA